MTAHEFVEDVAEPGLRILSEMVEHSARIHRLRVVREEEEGEADEE